MIPKIKTIKFKDGFIVAYDVKEDIENIPDFTPLKTEIGLFKSFSLDESRTVISWSDRIDLPSDTIRGYGLLI